MAYALNNLGDVAMCQGDLAQARSLHTESMTLTRELGDLQGVAESLESFAFLARAEGASALAVELFAAADALRRRIGTPHAASGRPAVDKALADLRRAIGEDEFAGVWTGGLGIPVAVAVAHAISEPRT
jgi:hypothetical protein